MAVSVYISTNSAGGSLFSISSSAFLFVDFLMKAILTIVLKPRQCIKKQRHHFADKGLCSQRELDHKEG